MPKNTTNQATNQIAVNENRTLRIFSFLVYIFSSEYNFWMRHNIVYKHQPEDGLTKTNKQNEKLNIGILFIYR